jgi:phosphatidylinositol alpha-1,6-mannosyltransferase
MRALALVTDAFGGYGGIARYNQEFLSALAAAPGIEDVHVLPRVGAFTDPLPPKLHQEPPVPSRVLYALTAMRIAISQKIDLIFCGHLYHSPLAVLLARFTRARLVCQTHGVEVGERPPPHQRLSMEQADTILCVSRDTRAKVLRWANIAPERAVVLSNTVDDIFTPGDGSRMRQLAGVRQAKVLLSVSRLDSRQQHKGQDRVIEALPGLIAAGLDVVYLVAGEGDDQPRLEALARARGVADRVRFLGHVPQADLPDLYRAADLFVLPSTGEGFGIVFLEAMACGTPAMGFALGGALDALEAGGFCVEPNDEALVRAICTALSRPSPERATLGETTSRLFGGPMFRQRVGLLLTEDA